VTSLCVSVSSSFCNCVWVRVDINAPSMHGSGFWSWTIRSLFLPGSSAPWWQATSIRPLTTSWRRTSWRSQWRPTAQALGQRRKENRGPNVPVQLPDLHQILSGLVEQESAGAQAFDSWGGMRALCGPSDRPPSDQVINADSWDVPKQCAVPKQLQTRRSMISIMFCRTNGAEGSPWPLVEQCQTEREPFDAPALPDVSH